VFGALIKPLNTQFTNPLVAETDWADSDFVRNIFYGLTSLILVVPLMLLATIQGALSGNKLVGMEMQSRFTIELVWPVRRIEMILSLIISKFCIRALGSFLIFVGTWLSFNTFGSAVAMNWTFVVSFAMSLTIALMFLGTFVLSMAISLLTKNETISAFTALFVFLFMSALFFTLHSIVDPSHSIPELAWMDKMDLLGWYMEIVSNAAGLAEGQPLNLVVLVVSVSIVFPLIIAIVLFRTLDIDTK